MWHIGTLTRKMQPVLLIVRKFSSVVIAIWSRTSVMSHK
jgi:hypothetical protein